MTDDLLLVNALLQRGYGMVVDRDVMWMRAITLASPSTAERIRVVP